jgi:hypothetical protein
LSSALWAAFVSAVVLLGMSGDGQAISAADIYHDASSSVVLIFGFGDDGAAGSGAGSIIHRDGTVLTNRHVIADSDTGRLFPRLVVYFKPKRISGDPGKNLRKPFLVDVIAHDRDLDLALLRVKNAPSGLIPIEITDSGQVEIGESVAMIGHLSRGGFWTLTSGEISNTRRDSARKTFHTDVALGPGHSGGPLLDENSRLIGVNSVFPRARGQDWSRVGSNDSLHSSVALAWVNRQGGVRINAVPRTTRQRGTSGTRPEPGVRDFKGPHGEPMYGVPNPTMDLRAALNQARRAYGKKTKGPDKSRDRKRRPADDYDNF